ncbi:MAG: hypothetical protein ABIG73_00085 [Patescibacteria group bacterium]
MLECYLSPELMMMATIIPTTTTPITIKIESMVLLADFYNTLTFCRM